MPYRKKMLHRPWLDGATYDKYDTPNCLHYDLFASQDAHGSVYFEIAVTERGKKKVAYLILRYEPALDYWPEGPVFPLGLAKIRWTRATHHIFRRAHARLLSMCVPFDPSYTSRTILCHYVKPYDNTPWPRNTVNTYKERVYGDKRPGRPRRTCPDIERANAAVAAAMTAAQIDILMAVQTPDA